MKVLADLPNKTLRSTAVWIRNLFGNTKASREFAAAQDTYTSGMPPEIVLFERKRDLVVKFRTLVRYIYNVAKGDYLNPWTPDGEGLKLVPRRGVERGLPNIDVVADFDDITQEYGRRSWQPLETLAPRSPKTLTEVLDILDDCPSCNMLQFTDGGASEVEGWLPIEGRLQAPAQAVQCIKEVAGANRDLLFQVAKWIADAWPDRKIRRAFDKRVAKYPCLDLQSRPAVLRMRRILDLRLKFWTVVQYLYDCPPAWLSPWRSSPNGLIFDYDRVYARPNSLYFDVYEDFIRISKEYKPRPAAPVILPNYSSRSQVPDKR